MDNFDKDFRRLVTKVLIIAGAGTGSGMTIAGGCVPADCGEYDDEPTYFQNSPMLEERVSQSLADFTADSPDATARQKLDHLYGTSGLYNPDYEMTQVALTLLEELAAEEGGTISQETCQSFCYGGRGNVESCRVTRDEASQDAELRCTGVDKSGCIGGREPAGLASDGMVICDDPRGAYWAYLSHLEACAVHAFAALHEELVHHGAPSELQTMALRAMHDEIVHVGLTAHLARRFGAEPAEAQVTRPEPRPLFDLALENAQEGCIREAFGALEMRLQSTLVDDPEIAATLQRISADETFHAELSWAIDAWAQQHLTADEQQAVGTAKQQALDTLRSEVASRTAAQAQAMNIPNRQRGLAILDAMEEELLV